MVLIMGVIAFAVGVAVGVKHSGRLRTAVRSLERRWRSGQ